MQQEADKGMVILAGVQGSDPPGVGDLGHFGIPQGGELGVSCIFSSYKLKKGL